MPHFLYKLLSYIDPKAKFEAQESLEVIRSLGDIVFDIKQHTDETGTYYVARAKQGNKSIITSGKDIAELDANIKDRKSVV